MNVNHGRTSGPISWMPEDYEPGLVSVIIPTYNRAGFLREALESVLAQTYRPIECIVVDDGSTDETQDVVKTIMSDNCADFCIRYEWQKNSGACAARNRGLVVSRGEFINFLDSDDLLVPQSLEWKVSSLSETPCDFAYGVSEMTNKSGALLKRIGKNWPDRHSALITAYLFTTNSALLRRSVCVRIGPWDERLRGAQEIDYFSRVKALDHTGKFIGRTTDIYRIHSSPSVSQKRLLSHAASLLIVCQRLSNLVKSRPHNQKAEMHELSKIYLSLVFPFYDNNCDYRALYCMKKAFSLHNRNWKLLLFLGISRFLSPRKTLALRYAKVHIRRYMKARQEKAMQSTDDAEGI